MSPVDPVPPVVRLAVALMVFAAFFPGSTPARTPAGQGHPNVIVILADDLGYECLSVNGSASCRTPHLDRLAAEGVRFTQCHAQPNCTPTRVQLMTGQSNVRNYVEFGTLERSQTTFAHLFRRAGYATAITGKWQLGSRDASLARHFGFDEHCLWSFLGRGERYADPSLTVNGDFRTLAGRYGPDVCQQFALDFLRRHRDRPFLLYYPMILVHGGYEATPDSADWRGPTARDRQARQRHFGEMVAYMDKQVGALVAELSALGLRDSTLILFTGDNGTGRGAVTQLADGTEQEGEKGATTRAGMRVPLLASWPGRISAGTVCSDLVDMTDFLPTLLEATGVQASDGLVQDGRSFLPQLQGERGRPREWIYSYWVPLRERQTAHLGPRGAVEQAFDHQFKLYGTGEFFDTLADPHETRPLSVATLGDERAVVAAGKLQAALDGFKDARPAHLDPPRVPGTKKKRAN